MNGIISVYPTSVRSRWSHFVQSLSVTITPVTIWLPIIGGLSRGKYHGRKERLYGLPDEVGLSPTILTERTKRAIVLCQPYGVTRTRLVFNEMCIDQKISRRVL